MRVNSLISMTVCRRHRSMAEWPVQDAVVDLVVSTFAPKNFPEAARVLRPGGWLVVAYPGPDHMVELCDRFGLLRQHEDKTQRYSEAAKRFIGLPSVTRLRSHAVLDGVAIRSAILMGPNARHINPSTLDTGSGALAVTFDTKILFARKPERKP
jgi:23S rRNA (guanine745-N1)-methyltransferase